MSSRRLQKINELLKQEVSQIILKEMNLPPACFITVTGVDTSADISQAKINVSIMPPDQRSPLMDQLGKRASFFRHLLTRQMVIRKVPKLIFKLNESQSKVDRVNELIDKIHTAE